MANIDCERSCCVVTNMMDEIYAARKRKVEAVYPVAARGKVR